MKAITKKEFNQIYRQRISDNSNYLRLCNENQINYFCEMMKLKLLSKYIIK